MERSKLLKQTLLTCKLISFLQLFGIVLATAVLIHWHFDKGFYDIVKVNKGEGISLSLTTFGQEEKVPDFEEKNITLSQVDPASIYIFYFQSVALMAILFLIFQEFGNVVHSVKNVETFNSANITSFRKIAKYLLVVFWLSGIQFISINGAARVGFDFDFTPLILMLVAYVLAEIFKEGNRLYEEEQLTV